MKWLFQPLLLLVAKSTESELAKQVEYLKAENQMLRKRLPKRVRLTTDEKKLLVKLGQAIGKAATKLLSIVAYSTYRSWLPLFAPEAVRTTPKPAKGKGGRPRVPNDTRELVLKLARENDWGYTRILGELKKLGITKICRTTVINILKENQLDPKTDPTKGTWADFLKAHAKSLWQCDFFSKHIVTADGVIRQCFILAFVHIYSRRVFLSPCTFKPDGAWMKQQADAFLSHATAQDLPVEVVLRDRDSKYTAPSFDGKLQAAGVRVTKVGFRAPNMNAYVERFVQAIQQECLDQFIIFGTEHFDHVCREYLEHYHTERPHQAMGNVPLIAAALPAGTDGKVVCRERLGGVLRHYYREAA